MTPQSSSPKAVRRSLSGIRRGVRCRAPSLPPEVWSPPLRWVYEVFGEPVVEAPVTASSLGTSGRFGNSQDSGAGHEAITRVPRFRQRVSRVWRGVPRFPCQGPDSFWRGGRESLQESQGWPVVEGDEPDVRVSRSASPWLHNVSLEKRSLSQNRQGAVENQSLSRAVRARARRC